MENEIPATSTFTQVELEHLLQRAAEKGAQKALADVGLDCENAENDIRDLRTLLRAFKMAKRTACQTFVRLLTAGVLAALMAGVAIKLKLVGGS